MVYSVLFYATMMADDQAVDAPGSHTALTDAAAQAQLQKVTTHTIAMQEALRPPAELSPGELFSATHLAGAIPVALIDRTFDWIPPTEVVSMVTAAATPFVRPSVYNATCTVRRASDDNQTGSLRWCIEQSPPLSRIEFDPAIFTTNTPVTITLTAPLPAITKNGIFLDGCQYDMNSTSCTTHVILSGLDLTLGSGLVISGASGVTINGLTIHGFPDDGILIQGGTQDVLIGDENGHGRNIITGNGRKPSSDRGDDAHPAGIRIRGATTSKNFVLGNYIGVVKEGNSANGNKDGIQIINGAHNNRIGGVTAVQRNLISGNHEAGVYIANGSYNNYVQGNYIGVDKDGHTSLGNRWGIYVAIGSNQNWIGDTAPAAGNLVSGNTDIHIRIETASQYNRVQGNIVGLDRSGTYTMATTATGISISQASHNQIGGTEVGARNLIAGCNIGVSIGNERATYNVIQGNWLGVDSSGQKALGNGSGITIFQGSYNLIGGESNGARNLIAGSQLNGIELLGDNNQVVGNWIGVDSTGLRALGNEQTGILIETANNNLIGGETAPSRNLISGNGVGVFIQSVGTTQNQIKGNWIGVDPSGIRALGNLGSGIAIVNGPQSNLIGGETSGERNLISGNGRHGINIFNAHNNVVLGNYVGTDVTGSSRLGNKYIGILLNEASKNEIGGAKPGMGNLISGNDWGIDITAGSNGNTVQGNKIGVDISGNAAISNAVGILIFGSARNRIGGSTENERNIISGNTDAGIQILQQSQQNTILGNFIGLDSTGTNAVRISASSVITPQLQWTGISIGSGANGNFIGGPNVGEGNVISGHKSFGLFLSDDNTTNNRIIGNLIGVDHSGTHAVDTQFGGIGVAYGATGNYIGGTAKGEGNVISGHSFAGVAVSGSSRNQIIGNLIGTDRSGTNAIGNFRGVQVYENAQENKILHNVISGNRQLGILLLAVGTNGNEVKGNLLGVDRSGLNAMGNGIWGIIIESGPSKNVIGGAEKDERNVISGNGETGLTLYGEQTIENLVQGNYIGINISGTKAISNGMLGIRIDAGASSNIIGGLNQGEGNIISGNGMIGIRISDTISTKNEIIGNIIGANVTGQRAIGNGLPGASALWDGSGVFLFGAQDNRVAHNWIGGNHKHGILVLGVNASYNHLHDNHIGLSFNNTELPNRGVGLWIEEAHDNQIGISNTIAFNGQGGIVISGTHALGNQVTRNLIFQNRGNPLALEWRAVAPTGTSDTPFVLDYTPVNQTFQGKVCAACRIEIYTSAINATTAEMYMGSTTADATGAFTLPLATAPGQPYAMALVTRPDGTTLPILSAKGTLPSLNLYLFLPIVQR
ncbi:MAG: NosD domain-containing protein [Caldilineaceae bacterium]